MLYMLLLKLCRIWFLDYVTALIKLHVGVATWLFATPVCDSVLRPGTPKFYYHSESYFVGAKASFA